MSSLWAPLNAPRVRLRSFPVLPTLSVLQAPPVLIPSPSAVPADVRVLSGREILKDLTHRLKKTSPSRDAGPAAGILSETFDAARLGPDAVDVDFAGPDGTAAGGIAEIRGAGLLLLDLKDSTRLFRRKGNRRSYEAVATYLDFAAALAQSHGGTVVRRVGDGLLLLFPRMGAAIDAGIEIQSRIGELHKKPVARMEFKIAAHGGRVLVDNSRGRTEIYGHPVEQTSELLDRAHGGEVVIHGSLIHSSRLRPHFEGQPIKEDDGILRIKPKKMPRPAGSSGVELPPIEVRFSKAATLFADLVDWSGKYDEFGRRRAFETVSAFHEFVAGIVAGHGGRVVKTEGDVLMATFPKAADSIRAADEIQSRAGELRVADSLGEHIAIRVGISYGRVIKESSPRPEDYYGNTVNAAARLLQAGMGGEILISEAVLADPEAKALLVRSRTTRDLIHPKGIDGGIGIRRLEPGSLGRSKVE